MTPSRALRGDAAAGHDGPDRDLLELRAFGLSFPGAHTKSPWPGHLDLAVKDKTFAYLSIEGQPFHISCKLPQSGPDALWLPFTKPTAYGLGKSGWVTAELEPGEPVPVELFKRWIDESYRAQAPRTLVKQLAAAANGLADAPPPAAQASAAVPTRSRRAAATAKPGAAPGAKRSR